MEIAKRNLFQDAVNEKNNFNLNSSIKSTRSKSIFQRSQTQLTSSALISSAPTLLLVSSSTLRFKKQAQKEGQPSLNRKSKEESRTQWYSIDNNDSENENDTDVKNSSFQNANGNNNDQLDHSMVPKSRGPKTKSVGQLRISPNINSLNLSLSTLSNSYPQSYSVNNELNNQIEANVDSKPPPLPAKHSSLDYMALMNLETRSDWSYEKNYLRNQKNSFPNSSIIRKKPLPPPPSPRYIRKSVPNSNGAEGNESSEFPKKPLRCSCSSNVPNISVPTN